MHKLKPVFVALAATPFAAFPTALLAQRGPQSLGEEVVVTATRTAQPASRDIAPTTVVSREDIENSNAESVQDILQQRVPGLQMSSNGGMGKTTSLHMRGTNSEHVLVLINGIKHNSATSGGAAIQHIPLEQIERIEVVRGPRSSLYGSEALGGVIQIFTREGKPGFQPHAKAGYGSHATYRASAGVRGGSEATRYSANLGYVESEWINVQEGNNPDDDGYDNTSGSLSLSQEVGDGGKLDLSLLYAQGTSAYDGDAPSSYDPSNPVDYELDFVEQSAQARYRQSLGSAWLSTLQAGESRDEQDYLEDGQETSHYDTQRSEVSWENQFFLSSNQDLLIGVDYREDRVDTSVDYVEDSRENRAVFGHWNWQRHKLQAQFGLRHDDNEAYGEHTTGDAQVGYRLSPELRLTASYGTAFKAPTFNDLFYPKTFSKWGVSEGNKNLEAETSSSVEFGLIGDAAWGSWEVRTFETRIDDLIQWETVGGVTQPQNVDEARIRGLELSAEVNRQGWQVRPSLTFLDPENDKTGDQLSRRAEQTFKLDVQRAWQRWSLGGSVFAQSERYDDADNTQELPAYGLLHLRGGYRFTEQWQLRAKVDNALDQDYQTAKGYNQPGRTYFVSVSYGAR